MRDSSFTGKAAEESAEEPADAIDRKSPSPVGAPPIALTIAGFDPSSGAGVTADLMTFAAHGVFGVSCITALTVQSTLGVQAVTPLSPGLIRATLECLGHDIVPAGVKIGMLGEAGIVAEVAAFLRGMPQTLPTVLDPVLRSTSGAPLLEPAGVDTLLHELLPCVRWITPNLAELAVLNGESSPQAHSSAANSAAPNAIADAARRLQDKAARGGNPNLNVVVTGGHLPVPNDYVLLAGGEDAWLAGDRVPTRSTHGTGCAFSSALLCALLQGSSGFDAARQAKAFVAAALRSAFPLGHGAGPLNLNFGRSLRPNRNESS